MPTKKGTPTDGDATGDSTGDVTVRIPAEIGERLRAYAGDVEAGVQRALKLYLSLSDIEAQGDEEIILHRTVDGDARRLTINPT